MKNIVKKYIQILTYKNYSKRTIEVYTHYLEIALNEMKTNPYQLTTSKIRNYLFSREYTSISQQNQIIGSIKLFAKYILGKKDIHLSKIERPKKQKSLPRIIDAKFLKEQISTIHNLKHKTIISIGFACALRVSEVINLKLEHIDSKRMVIHIHNAKGRKDRVIRLSQNLLELLREYYKQYRPKNYLFEGQSKPQYSTTSCNKIVKKYLGNQYHFHLLRHSGLTNMHENNVDIATLSKIAGHNSIKTTMIYTHITNNVIQNSYSPI